MKWSDYISSLNAYIAFMFNKGCIVKTDRFLFLNAVAE